ncbi:Anaerobic dimethyl sulfoxide reductase chain B [Fundidesulfovibrio magnetotacticus]|uniref:Anaerobic dimethyl sulfoxide reductase chain B n=1 Tax=Fundidesulfovibrio magnetotacticus TaxID=2730080 RepID=A0A6V8LI70_9BACT|nr:4Fe-4S dicluster domain-containing protein [Fundidesulfovibrio magnetotacticus]GFK92413.1 Anaerobic dimethyl sulfoxide reductase chain B [Fundidesulfovibrio magnetotacticus]
MLKTIDPKARFSRRTLFKALGLGGAAALLPERSRAAALPVTGQELATFLDLSKCIGCGACVEACRVENAARYPEPKKPFPKMYPERVKVEDWSDKRAVDTRLTPYNWLFIQSAAVDGREVHIPRRCMHCQNPPCANLCPWGAAAREADGTVAINQDICLGGAKCRDVCPWSIPQRQTGAGLYLDLMPSLAGNGVMNKCRRCPERVAQGKMPACIEACPQGVQTMGPREEIVAQAKAMARNNGGFLYGLEENGGTNTLYLSPVPFEKLAAAVKTGPGQPGLAAVADVMGTSNRLAWAVLLAPLAGAAGALLSGARKMMGRKEDSNG